MVLVFEEDNFLINFECKYLWEFSFKDSFRKVIVDDVWVCVSGFNYRLYERLYWKDLKIIVKVFIDLFIVTSCKDVYFVGGW